jgi:two-component system nitrogen regulation sensor histidine kinase NtrY
VTLARRFVIYLVVVHLVFAAAAFGFLRDHRLWLLALEAFFLLSFLAGWRLLRQQTEPLRLLDVASRRLEEGDFTTRLRPHGPPEVAQLVRIYNRMVDELREERIHGREQEAFLERVLEASAVGVVTMDLDGRVARMSPGAARLLDIDPKPALGRRLEEMESRFARAVAGIAPGDIRVVPLAGPRRVRAQMIAFPDRGFTRHALVLEELSEELRRSEKSAYDRLIRMMSHEVNNTSGAVRSLLQSCLTYREQIDAEHRGDYTGALEVSMNRIDHMNTFMRHFADVVRLPAPHPVPADAAALLSRLERLVSAEFAREGVGLRREGVAAIPPVALDEAQAEQALLNILKNAREAAGAGGTVTIELHRDGAFGRIVVADSGPGVPEALREQLFTPFFTTKENGQGVGLIVVREVLLGHGFDFSLERRNDRTEFTIRMPLA